MAKQTAKHSKQLEQIDSANQQLDKDSDTKAAAQTTTNIESKSSLKTKIDTTKNQAKSSLEKTDAKGSQLKMSTTMLIRKLVFLSSLLIPIGYACYFSKWTMVIGLAIATAIIYYIDYNRHYSKFWQKIALLLVGKIMTKDEKSMEGRLMHCTVYLISSTFTVLLLPKTIAIFVMSLLIVSDTAAAIVGNKYGKTPIFKNKTMEGFEAFVVSGCCVSLIMSITMRTGLGFLINGIIATIFAGITELLADKFDLEDDYAIPAVAGLIMCLMSLL